MTVGCVFGRISHNILRMFGIFKFRKLNSVLEEANITGKDTGSINMVVLDCNLPLFDPRQQGR